jgi:hypothetical protein
MMSNSSEKEMMLSSSDYGDGAVSMKVETPKSQDLQRQQQLAKAKALSMTFMKSFSGICSCDDCDDDPFKTVENSHGSDNNNNAESIDDNSNYSISLNIGTFGSDHASAISPLVVAPMMVKNLNYQKPGTVETLVGEYMCFCKFYNVHYNSGILTALRFPSPSLRPSGAFHDTDMLALVEVLLRHANGALKHITRLDFSIPGKQGRHERNNKLIGFTSHGALSLAKALQTTKYIREVFLPRNKIGPYGASAIFMACRMNPSIEDLNLSRCRIGKRGALAFCEIILLGMDQPPMSEEKSDDDHGTSASSCGLVNVNLSLNHIGHQGTSAIGTLLKETISDDQIAINMDGNLVFPEVSDNFVSRGYISEDNQIAF